MTMEDGKPEVYTIKGYKRIRHKSPYKSVDDILVISTTIVFECQVMATWNRLIV